MTDLSTAIAMATQAAPAQAAREKVSEEEIQAQAAAMIAAGYNGMVAPQAFRELAEFLAYRKVRRNRKGILLIGQPGTGKTTWLQKFSRCRIVSAISLPSMFVEYGEHQAMAKLFPVPEYDLYSDGHFDMALDDIGSETTLVLYGSRMETVATAIQKAYERWKSGLATYYASTNLTMDQIGERYGERVASRCFEMFALVHVIGKDQRRLGRKA